MKFKTISDSTSTPRIGLRTVVIPLKVILNAFCLISIAIERTGRDSFPISSPGISISIPGSISKRNIPFLTIDINGSFLRSNGRAFKNSNFDKSVRPSKLISGPSILRSVIFLIKTSSDGNFCIVKKTLSKLISFKPGIEMSSGGNIDGRANDGNAVTKL